MSHRIITIEREYASGGREIGELIANRLGIPCYNREILKMASERCNVSMDYLETAEEAAPKSFLYTLMLTSSPTRTIEENLPLSDKVYIIETNIIRELAEQETVLSWAGVPATFSGIWNICLMCLSMRIPSPVLSAPFRNIMWIRAVQKLCCGKLTSVVKRSTASIPAETGMTRTIITFA